MSIEDSEEKTERNQVIGRKSWFKDNLCSLKTKMNTAVIRKTTNFNSNVIIFLLFKKLNIRKTVDITELSYL